MFKKLVSNLPFSPALIRQFGFYAMRLKKEQFLRKLSLIFTIFAIILQSLIIISPPQSANATPKLLEISCSDQSKSNSAECQEKLQIKKTAINLSQGNIDATTIVAKPGDTIMYTIKIENFDTMPQTTSFVDNLTDVLEYSEIFDQGGGEFEESSKNLAWKDLRIEAQSTIERNFMIKIKHQIPVTATGVENKNSQDCVITNQAGVGNSGAKVDIDIACPPAKILESEIIQQLPKTNISANLIFSSIILLIVVFFYARSRQIEKEIRLIRKNFNQGNLENF